MAKHILTAFIEQVVQLDSEADYKDYIDSLKRGRTLYFIKDVKRDATGKVFVTIRKQYNNNVFPDNAEGGE